MTVAAIIIGDEILSGKETEENSRLLITTLASHSVPLKRLTVIGDSLEEICDEVRRSSELAAAVITSGGVGPTHDDRTFAGVALAFGVPLERHPELSRLIHAYWKERVNEAALKMADVPRGSTLCCCDDSLLPIVQTRNVYMLPGIPQLFASKLAYLAPLLVRRALVLHSIFVRASESAVAELLAEVESSSPGVHIGSYPRLEDPEYNLKITVEGQELPRVTRATDRLLEGLGPDSVIRVRRNHP